MKYTVIGRFETLVNALTRKVTYSLSLLPGSLPAVDANGVAPAPVGMNLVTIEVSGQEYGATTIGGEITLGVGSSTL